MDKKFKLYVVRHGETYLNRYKKMQGWADSPLTDEVKEIAIQTGKRLADVKFDSVYTSDSGRTVETAELILQSNQHGKGLKINRRKDFREMFFGGFEGEYSEVVWKKIARDNGYERFDDLHLKHSIEDFMNLMKKSDHFGHAENFNELWERIQRGLEEVIANSHGNNENILLVTHGVVIRNILGKFSSEFSNEIEIKNSSISQLEYSGNSFKVVSYNQ
jgi:broad specificity phosphatase PhoE